MSNLQPTSKTDAVARQHDVDYMISSGSALGAIKDDVKALSSSLLDPSLESLAMRLGLSTRTLLSILTAGQTMNYNNNMPGLSNAETQELGKQLNQYLIDSQSVSVSRGDY